MPFEKIFSIFRFLHVIQGNFRVNTDEPMTNKMHYRIAFMHIIRFKSHYSRVFNGKSGVNVGFETL